MNHARSLAAAALLLAIAGPLSAQSLFATRGLGVPAAPVDARAAALGGIGIGLIGFHTSLVSPAEIAGITRRGVSAVLQPVNTSAEVDGVTDNTAGTRFPVLRIIYPISDRLVTSVAYGSYLEQSWAVATESERQLGGQTVTVHDLLRSAGGIAQLRLDGAYWVSPTLAVGATAGLLTGNVERLAARRFSGDTTGELRPFEDRMRWNYLAPIAGLGVRWDVAGIARFGASALVGGNLEATGVEGRAEDRSYGSPLALAAGASARVTPLINANAGAIWQRMPAVDSDNLVSTETVRVGGGIEYQGVRSGARTYPVRLGARWEQLPYHLQNEEQASEWSAGLGIGFRLGEPVNPAALADITLERAERTGLGGAAVTSLSERMWRITFSLSLFGN
jgi:hypothetical protein